MINSVALGPAQPVQQGPCQCVTCREGRAKAIEPFSADIDRVTAILTSGDETKIAELRKALDRIEQKGK